MKTPVNPPRGSANIEIKNGVIVAVYKGAMSFSLLEETNKKIRRRLEEGNGRIIYDTRQITSAELADAMQMHGFMGDVGPKFSKAVVLVANNHLAFLAKMAIALTMKNHRIFYEEDAAMAWLTM